MGRANRVGRRKRQLRREKIHKLRVLAICDSKTPSPLGPHGPARRAITPQSPMEARMGNVTSNFQDLPFFISKLDLPQQHLHAGNSHPKVGGGVAGSE